jgi:hypothetical protein
MNTTKKQSVSFTHIPSIVHGTLVDVGSFLSLKFKLDAHSWVVGSTKGKD